MILKAPLGDFLLHLFPSFYILLSAIEIKNLGHFDFWDDLGAPRRQISATQGYVLKGEWFIPNSQWLVTQTGEVPR